MRIILLSALIIMIAACGSDSTESTDRKDGYSNAATTPEDSLFQEVMHEHDVAMPKMGRLEGYRKQAVAKADSLKKVKSGANGALVKDYEQLGNDLQQAQDNMNKWMSEFQHDSAQNDAEKRIQYLSSEKEKVTKVKDEILSVLEKAERELKK